MTNTTAPDQRSKKSFWRTHALAACVMVASLTPLATNAGCSAPETQGCPVGYTNCSGYCVPTAEDPSNCGACGAVCAAEAPYCSQGICSASCAPGLAQCGNGCADTQTSLTNCGGCGIACSSGMVCQTGACICPAGVTCDPVVGAGGGANPGAGGGANPGAGGGANPGIGGGANPGAGGGTDPGAGGGTASGGSEGGEPIGGYHVHGDWAGFTFTFVEEAKISTITPEDFGEMIDEDGPYCVSGTVPTSEEYTNIAAFGVHTNQAKVEDADIGTVASAGDGIVVDVVVNSGTETLRVQLEDGTDPMAEDAEMHRWCAGISGTGEHPLPWSEFTTKCWCALDSTDEACEGNEVFDGRAIAKVIVYVPEEGPDGDDADFDFCINDIGPTNIESRGTGEILADCGNSSVTWGDTISDPFGQVNAGNYSFQNNAWNLVNGSQTAQLLSGAGFRLTQQSCNTATDAPCSFPSVYVGTDADGTKTSGFNAMPISNINTIPTCLGWSSGGTPASDEYNVSYDVWFNSNAGANNAEKFLMVWFRDPPSFQPGGMTPIATSVIGDQSWSIWFGPNAGGQDVVSFVAPNKRADGQAYSFDLKDFIDEAVDRGYLAPSLNLIAIMGGMEVWGGGQGASIDGFRAEVQ